MQDRQYQQKTRYTKLYILLDEVEYLYVVQILFHQSADLFVKIPIQTILRLICKTKVANITRIHFSVTAKQITSLSVLLGSLSL